MDMCIQWKIVARMGSYVNDHIKAEVNEMLHHPQLLGFDHIAVLSIFQQLIMQETTFSQ